MSGHEGTTHNELEAGWHADPYGRFERRWWTGQAWSERVASGRTQSLDPPGVDAAPDARIHEGPADPIHDAHLPIAPPPAAPTVVWWISLLVFAALVVLIVLSALALS